MLKCVCVAKLIERMGFKPRRLGLATSETLTGSQPSSTPQAFEKDGLPPH